MVSERYGGQVWETGPKPQKFPVNSLYFSKIGGERRSQMTSYTTKHLS